MSNLMYTIAVILFIFWMLGFFVYNVGNIIHVLFVLALILALTSVIKGRSKR